MVELERQAVSLIEGRTTPVRGRFDFTGPGFHLVSDAAVATGGPGEFAGSLDLLVVGLANCLLNRLRGGGADPEELIPGREVRLYARAERYPFTSERMGQLTLEVFITGVDDEQAEHLVADYRAGCRIHRALSTVLDIDIIASGE